MRIRDEFLKRRDFTFGDFRLFRALSKGYEEKMAGKPEQDGTDGNDEDDVSIMMW